MASVALSAITKDYGRIRALESLDLSIDDGEFIALLGPSGCGKTTTLNIVAGLEEPSTGKVLIGDRDCTRVPAMDRDIAMVFQSYALYPHMTVARNLGFALEVRKLSKESIRASVMRASEMLNLTPYLDRYPRQLSGGQRQRVALGRALVRDPQVFLLDEPLSNLDAVLRLQMRAEIVALFQELRTTALYVTHDQAEAMTMADRIAVFRNGKLLQYARPLEVYRAPVDRFVASFVGSPPMSFADATAGEGTVRFGPCEVAMDVPAAPGKSLEVGLRPESLVVGEGGHPMQVSMIEHLGGTQIVTLSSGPLGLSMLAPATKRLSVGETVPIRIDPSDLYLFDPQTEKALISPGTNRSDQQ